MLFAALDDFYLTAEQLEASPSRADGVSGALEEQLRRYGTDLIGEVVVLLDLPQVVACTAQVLFHRFYCKRSLLAYDVKVITMAAFWLACKLEEVIEIDSPTKLRLRDVITMFYRVIRRRDGRSLEHLDPGSRQYADLKTEVVLGERRMLRALGFVLHAEHPHHLVLAFARMLFIPETAVQTAWNYANDSLRTTLCVRHKAEAVACGALFLAARTEGVCLPESHSGPWWSVFGVSNAVLAEVCSALLVLQRQPAPKYVCLRKDLTSRSTDVGPSSASAENAAGLRPMGIAPKTRAENGALNPHDDQSVQATTSRWPQWPHGHAHQPKVDTGNAAAGTEKAQVAGGKDSDDVQAATDDRRDHSDARERHDGAPDRRRRQGRSSSRDGSLKKRERRRHSSYSRSRSRSRRRGRDRNGRKRRSRQYSRSCDRY